MVVAVRLHGMDETQVIHLSGQIGEKLGGPHAALAMLTETEGAGHQIPAVHEHILEARFFHRFTKRGRDRLAIELLEQRFVVKGVQRGGTADHVQEDHGFGPGRKVWHPGQFRLRRVKFDHARARLGTGALLPEQ